MYFNSINSKQKQYKKIKYNTWTPISPKFPSNPNWTTFEHTPAISKDTKFPSK